MLAQKIIDAAIGQQLGNEAARHDGALVHVKRHALQPCLAGEVGSGFAGANALVKKCSYQRKLIGRYSLLCH